MSISNSTQTQAPTRQGRGPAGWNPQPGMGRRGILIFLLFALFLILMALLALFISYILSPAPLPELIAAPAGLNYQPHYVFSIFGVDKPVSVAASPDGERIYVAESGGERVVKVFDREGELLGSFAPPLTITPERSPVYLATSSDGRVFVSDRAQHAVFVFNRDGVYLDTILSPELSLSEYLAKHLNELPAESVFAYNIYQGAVYYQLPGAAEASSLPAPDLYDWSPLGLRFDASGQLLITDITEGQHQVIIFPADVAGSTDWKDFHAGEFRFGSSGKGAGELDFPNSAVADSRGRVFVVDGNNSRISVWDSQGNFLFNFGRGSGEGVVNLPRGAIVDDKDRLYVVDAVDQRVKVYDVSADEITFLFSFGDFGVGDGQFNYPNDIAVDRTGRIYVADRENDRIQVWLY